MPTPAIFGRDKQRPANRRCVEPDHQIEHHDQAEMNWIDHECLGHRDGQRCGQHRRGQWLNEHANEDQREVQQRPENILVVRDRREPTGVSVWLSRKICGACAWAREMKGAAMALAPPITTRRRSNFMFFSLLTTHPHR
jgi:hypothetical protein